MNFIKNESKIYICDIGASPCDPTEHLEDLLKKELVMVHPLLYIKILLFMAHPKHPKPSVVIGLMPIQELSGPLVHHII